MQNLRLYILCILLVFSLPYTYGGCSGGRGDDGGINTGLTYTDSTSPAEINESNVQNIFRGALGAGIITDDTVGLSVDQVSEAQRNLNFRSVRIPLIINDLFNLIDFSYPVSGKTPLTYTKSDILDGRCGGTMSYIITMDDILTGVFEGSITFSNYCENGITINGIVDLSGVFDEKTSGLQEVDFLFDNLTAGLLQIGRLRFDGEIGIYQTDPSRLITFTVYARDQLSRKVYYVDYTMAVYKYAGFVEVEISGEFYHPDYGYVTIDIQEPLVVHDGDIWPTSGILIITGASNTSAKLTVIDHTSCIIEVDFDGDGDYDWDSGIIGWEDL